MINACGDDPAFVDQAYNTRHDTHLFLVRHAKVDTGGLMYGGGTDPEPVDDDLGSSTEIKWLSAEIQRRSRCARELEAPTFGHSGHIDVHTSPLIRAHRTARAIARVDFGDHNEGMYSFIRSPDRADDLTERNFGDLEGKPFVDMLAEHGGGSWGALYAKARDNAWAESHGVETQGSVLKRTEQFLYDKVDQHRRRDIINRPQIVHPQHTIIVGHRAALRVMLGALLMGRSTETYGDHRVPGLTPSAIAFADSIGLDNLSLTHVVIRYNDTDYNKTSESPMGSPGGERTGSRGEVTIRALNLTCPETDEANPWLERRNAKRALAAEAV